MIISCEFPINWMHDVRRSTIFYFSPIMYLYILDRMTYYTYAGQTLKNGGTVGLFVCLGFFVPLKFSLI